MPVRRLPVRPNLDQLHRQAKELLRAIHAGNAEAIAEWREHQPESTDPSAATLADAQLALARSYSASSWTRLVHAVELIDAIWRDDLDTVRTLVARNPALIHEPALLRADSNWGPPMSYAANLGRDGIIRFLHSCGAKDLEMAAGRAALQSKPDTVRLIYDLAGRPSLEKWTLAGPAYTLSVEGTAVLLTLGARVVGPNGVDHNTMEHLLGTDSRNPPAKHRILEMYVEHGFEPPDTPVMALHRGRIDLLEAHLARDPGAPDAHLRQSRRLSARSGLRGGPVHRTGNARARDDDAAYRGVFRRGGNRGVADRPRHGSGRARGPRRRRLRRLHRPLFDGRVPAKLLGELRQGSAG
jgi:hypothetical protein